MKLIFARQGYSNSGGAERYLRRLVSGLKKRGIQTTLFNNGEWPREDWPGDEIETLDAHSPAGFAEAVARAKSHHPDALLFSFERIPCADIFRAGDGIHTAFLKRQASEGPPLASWFRGTRRQHKETCALEKELFTRNERLHVICNSEMVATELRSIFDFPDEKITTIYNGFTPKPWDQSEREVARAEVRHQLGISEDAPIILFVGSGWKRKGVEPLATAFKNIVHPEAHLLVVGKGRLKQSSSPRIHLTGAVSDPRQHYLASDLFALPTLYDPFSNACLEAATFGLPVLTTDGNGFAEALQRFPGSGDVIPNPRNPALWTDALDIWLNKKPDHAAIDKLVAAHTMDLNVSKTVDLLTTLAQNNTSE